MERVEIEENVHLKMRFFDIFNPEYESLPEDPEFRPLGERREKLCTKNDLEDRYLDSIARPQSPKRMVF